MTRVLHGFFRSSAAYRVRIALNLKDLGYRQVTYNLRKGEQNDLRFQALNPQSLVPAFEDGARVLVQSPAILEYLDEAYPDTFPLLPPEPIDRARVRALANIVCCDIHPVDNLRVLKYLDSPLGLDEAAVIAWYNHWIGLGFDAFEAMLTNDPRTGRFCHGDVPTLADVCLVPQLFNANRHALDLAAWPRISGICERCGEIEAFKAAHPANQPDAI